MTALQIATLGAIAGFTIFLGLPVGRLRNPSLAMKAFLNATATGVLLFLFWDVLAHAVEPVETALTAVTRDGTGSWMHFGALAAVAIASLTLGLMSLVYYEQWMADAKDAGAGAAHGPGAADIAELAGPRAFDSATAGRRLALLIAVGIGLHNFSEGLAIGQSAAAGEISLAVLLIVGFGLHNATEGFGIVAPLAAEPDTAPPSWAFLGLLGLIGGGPTFLGAALGHGFTSEPVSVAFLTLAAGSILYVITQLITVAAKARRSDLLAYGMLLGLLAGFATDAIVTLAGV